VAAVPQPLIKCTVFKFRLDRIPAVVPLLPIMRKSIFLASTSLVGLLATAPSVLAADLAPIMYKEAQSLPWAGAYFGVNAGYAWAGDPGVDCIGSLSGCAETTFHAAKPTGGVVGAQAGYNWQVAKWVFGVETDMDYLGVRGTTQFPGVDPAKGPDQTSSRYDWLGTTRARVGMVTGPMLFYATGGLAYGRVGHNYVTGVGSPDAQFYSMSQNQVGWTAGGGAEYALGRNWSLKAEYLYVHLAASSLNISGSAFPANTALRFNNNLNIVRVGANYRF
jgi:outer membrane immunogenic protein